jgi:HlyD family secretion protein
MSGSKRAMGLLAVGTLLWAGLGLLGSQAPLAGEQYAGAPRDHPAAGRERVFFRAEVQPQGQGQAEEIRSLVERPMTILSVAPRGKIVKKGDLLVELDASALVGERIQQIREQRKAEREIILARESLDREKRAAAGRVELAEKALALAHSQLKAFTEGEYLHQLAMAEGAAAIAKQKQLLMEDRVARVRRDVKTGDDSAKEDAYSAVEIALQEARLQAEETQRALVLFKSFVHDNRVAELELVVAQKEFDLACAKDAVSAAATRGGADLSLAEMNFHLESDRLARLDDQIGMSRHCAPRDGTILYPNEPNEPPIRPGTVVHPQQVLMYLLPTPPPKPPEPRKSY